MQVSRVKADDRLLITTNKGSGLLQACLSELFYNCLQREYATCCSDSCYLKLCT